jgi:hypothetical protein
MEIVTGYRGKPHITSEKWADLNRGIIGAEEYVLGVGRMFESELVSNNLLKIYDGCGVFQGREFSTSAGQSDEITIENGTQGEKRIDLIVARYTKNEDTKVETIEPVLIKGTPSASDPAVPKHTEGNIRQGDLIADMPLYEVELNGINVVEVRQLFQVLMNMNKINMYLSNLTVQKTSTQGGWVVEKYVNGWCKLYIKAQVYRASKEQTVYKLAFPDGMRLKNVRIQMTPAQNGWNVANFYHNTSGQTDDNAVISEAVIVFTAKDTTALTYCFDVCVSGFLV